MKQTTTANIGGVVFHIETEAFEKLNKYLAAIRSHFGNKEERDEILSDIESRLAELFTQKLAGSRQVVTEKDVNEVMMIMGNPDQFITDDGAEESSSSQLKSKKRFYRDPDVRILGGVASGISNYVGVDPVWIRLLFVIMFFLGFGGFFLYIILWIVIPEAKTAAQKLQMKGEEVNVENIGRTFEEAGEKFAAKMNSPEVKSIGSRLERFFNSLFHVLGVILNGILKAFVKIIGFIIVVAGILLALSIFGLLGGDFTVYTGLAENFSSIRAGDLMLTFFDSDNQYLWARIGLFSLLGIPIIGLIYGGLRLLFNIKGHTGLGAGLGILWLLSFFLCLFLGLKIGTQFKSESTVTERRNLDSSFMEYVLELKGENIPGDEVATSGDGEFLLHIDKSSIYYGPPTLSIERSYTDSIQLKIVKSAHGPSKNAATETASGITYVMHQNGELLSFESFLKFDRSDKIRGQNLRLTLLLPKGKIIYMDESLRNFIHDVDNVSDTWDEDMLGKKWVMLDKGLTCLDCPEIEGVTSDELKMSEITKEE